MKGTVEAVDSRHRGTVVTVHGLCQDMVLINVSKQSMVGAPPRARSEELRFTLDAADAKALAALLNVAAELVDVGVTVVQEAD